MAIVAVDGGTGSFLINEGQQIEHEPGATAGPCSLSVSLKRGKMLRFVQRLANMDVTEFTFSVLCDSATNHMTLSWC